MQESLIGDKGGKGQDVDACSDSADIPADSKTPAQSKGNLVSHSKKSKNRICSRCGKPIEGPNYFLCKKCHAFMSREFGEA
jgi:hypothetical protein